MNARLDSGTKGDGPAAHDAAGVPADATEALRLAAGQVIAQPAAARDAAAAAAAMAPQHSPVQQAGAAAQAVSLAGLPALLPRLSEYRIGQVGKAAAAFEREHAQFWQSSARLSALQHDLRDLARSHGLPLQDLAARMTPDGALAPVRLAFNEAVAQAPAAQQHRKAMDKALDSYIRQYGRAQEEILNPDLADNPHYDGLKARLAQSHAAMQAEAASVPAFARAGGGLDPSHGARLDAAVEGIGLKMEAARHELMAVLRGQRGSEPAP